MNEFKASEKIDGENLLLAFEGTIDEDVQFPAVAASKYKKVCIDLKEVRAINSVGIREWLNWIRPIAESSEIILMRCPKALVFQFNMVEGFLPNRASVSSFYVPFFCEKCDREENVLFSVGKEVALVGGAPKVTFDLASAGLCKEAECAMEMDVTESKYFQFLKKMA